MDPKPPGPITEALDQCAQVVIVLKSTVSEVRSDLSAVLLPRAIEEPSAPSARRAESSGVCSLAQQLVECTERIREAIAGLNEIQKDLQL
jgi:hypothetical protein